MTMEQPFSPKERTQAILGGIRQTLLALGSATKADLSASLGISFPTVSKFLARMGKQGELIVVGMDESSGGRRALRYAYNPEYRLNLALFLEKTETRYTICNCLGEEKEQGGAASFLPDDLAGLANRIEALLAAYPRIRTLAIGVPGAVREGRIIYIPGYDGFQDLDLKGYLEKRFALPVVVENDMNAAVLGYRARHGGNDDSPLLYLYFGLNGPGAGLLVNGDVVRGNSFFSGEVSFLPLYDHRSFQQALSDGKKEDAVGRLIASCTALLNPSTIVFCRDEADEALLAGFASAGAAYVPAEHLPRLALSDWKEDYLQGLQQLGLARMLAAAD